MKLVERQETIAVRSRYLIAKCGSLPKSLDLATRLLSNRGSPSAATAWRARCGLAMETSRQLPIARRALY